jgi:hypothetical protein
MGVGEVAIVGDVEKGTASFLQLRSGYLQCGLG